MPRRWIRQRRPECGRRRASPERRRTRSMAT
jgi:hypothetical protein